MPCHGKGKFGGFNGCLWCAVIVNGGEDEGACIQDDSQRSDPGLLLVLRTVKSQDGIGEVTLQNISTPYFPIMQEQAQLLKPLASFTNAIASQQFDGRPRRTSACVQ